MTKKSKVEATPDRALTFAEAEIAYGVPIPRLQHYRRQGRLQVFRLGRAIFVSEASLRELLESCREPRGRTGSEVKDYA